MKAYNILGKSLAALALSTALFGSQAQAFGLGLGYFKCLKQAPINYSKTIADLVGENNSFTILRGLINTAELGETLASSGPFTVYAPTDAAFGKIPAPLLSAIGSDIPLLTEVLTYHVSPGILDPRRAVLPVEIATVEGQTVFFNYGEKGPQINQSNVSCQAVRASNGIVWIIDSVLLPQFIGSEPKPE
ncbi:hypothetical protein JCM19379_00650 [Methyloparacoccus murrellii]